MASSTNNSSKMKLKLLIDKSTQKVLYAEAGKDFVDFLIYLLTLPLGTIVKVLKDIHKVGSFSHVYDSLENLPDSYLQPKQKKSSLLNPRAPIYTTEISVMLSDYDFADGTFYTCFSAEHCCSVAEVPYSICKNGRSMYRPLSYVRPTLSSNKVGEEGGFIKGLVPYLVMDDLQFMPMISIHVVNLLDKLNVKKLGAVEERAVEIGVEEV